MRKVEVDSYDLEAAFQGTGVETVTLNATSDHDWKVPENLYLDGGCFMSWDTTKGDYVECQVVDVDGVIAPAGTVLKTWIIKWYVSTQAGYCAKLETPYMGYVLKDLYLRVKYTSTATSGTQPTFIVNYLLHRKI